MPTQNDTPKPKRKRSATREQPTTNQFTGGDYWNYLSGGMPIENREEPIVVSESTALQCSTVLNCIRVIAETMSTLNLHLYKKLEDGGKEKAEYHPLYNLFRLNPNPEMSMRDLIELTVYHTAIWGNGYWELAYKNSGILDSIYPRLPDRMILNRVGGDLQYTYNSQGIKADIFPQNCCHFKFLSYDGLLGLNPIAMARQTIEFARYSERFGSDLFKSGANPSGYFKPSQKLSPDAQKLLSEGWIGKAKRRGVPILPPGIEWVPTTISPNDSQFLELRKYQRSELIGLYRVPPSKIGDYQFARDDDDTRFLADCILPWTKRIETEINRKLFPTGDYFVEFQINNLLRGDIAKQNSSFAVGRQWGWYSVNDIRDMQNMPPIEDGDIYLQPQNMVPAGTDISKIVPTYKQSNPDQLPAPAPNLNQSEPVRPARQMEPIIRETCRRIRTREIKAINPILGKNEKIIVEYREIERAMVTYLEPIAQSLQTDSTTISSMAESYCGQQLLRALKGETITDNLDTFVSTILNSLEGK